MIAANFIVTDSDGDFKMTLDFATGLVWSSEDRDPTGPFTTIREFHDWASQFDSIERV